MDVGAAARAANQRLGNLAHARARVYGLAQAASFGGHIDDYQFQSILKDVSDLVGMPQPPGPRYNDDGSVKQPDRMMVYAWCVTALWIIDFSATILADRSES
jgi:hypothetical protein